MTAEDLFNEQLLADPLDLELVEKLALQLNYLLGPEATWAALKAAALRAPPYVHIELESWLEFRWNSLDPPTLSAEEAEALAGLGAAVEDGSLCLVGFDPDRGLIFETA